MPIVGCALAMCDGEGCKAREVVPVMKAPNGQMAGDPPQGWTARMRSVVVPGKGPVELLCPACGAPKVEPSS